MDRKSEIELTNMCFIYDENRILDKWQFILEKTLLVIAVLNYLIVFAISFMKYGIF